MNKEILFDLLRSANKNPKHRRYLKIFLGSSLAFVVVTVGLFAWLFVAGFGYVSGQIRDGHLQSNLQKIQTGLEPQVAAMIKPSCLEQGMRLMNFETLLQKPIEASLQDIKTACFGMETKNKTPEPSKVPGYQDSSLGSRGG